MKKIISLLLAVIMAAVLAACGNKNPGDDVTMAETLSESVVETQAQEEAEAATVQIKDTEEFQKELGIDIDANLLYSEAEMFIVDKKIAECTFNFEDMGGNLVQCTFRASKDATAGDSLHGITDVDLVDETGRTVNTPDGPLSISRKATAAGDCSVYQWEIGDTYYCLKMLGFPNEMERNDVLDSCLLASGVEIVEDTFIEEEEYEEFEITDNGTVLTVRLESNPTTGYQWFYKIWDEGTIELVSEDYAQTPGTEGMAGAGGTWTAKFKAVDGHRNFDTYVSNYIEFTYARQWEGKGIPSRVVDLNITGSTMEITGVHNPDFTAEVADDGTYDVKLSFTDMIQENELSFYALVKIPETITLSDEEVKALKPGDVISLSVYGLDDVNVDMLEKQSETSIRINEVERLSFNKDLNAWVIVGWDDDIYSYTTDVRKVHFTNETKINDGMEEVMKTGNSGTIYDKMRSYIFVDAVITVQDGWVSEITIHYHP